MSSVRIREDKIHSEYDLPKVPLVSEGEKLIKDLIDKQLNKNTTLQNELSRGKQFERPTQLINETEFLSGKNNLSEFKLRAEHLQNIQELKSLGLIKEEIELYSDYQNGIEYILRKHKNICETVLREKLNNIFSKLTEKNETIEKERSFASVSRHVKEIALNTKPESLETKLFKFATSYSSKDEIDTNYKPLDHPIHSLVNLERKLFGHLDNPTIPPLKKRRKKAIKYLDNIESNSSSFKNNILPNFDLKTQWDVQELPSNIREKPNEKNGKIYSCASNRKYTIKNNEIVRLDSKDIEENQEGIKYKGKPFISGQINIEGKVVERLNEKEIKEISRFQNYEKGLPSKTLFIKNLAKQTKEEDLIHLFSTFDNDNKIIYRLLKGKMSGQAFVTFTNVDQATKALELVNGSVVKNKPVIIQYGKSS